MKQNIDYVDHEFIRKNTLEYREYQADLVNQSKYENCLIVLPTGLGKTAIAVQIIAHHLKKTSNATLFLAPTKVLINQHYEFLKHSITIFDIALITGDNLITKRKKLWKNSIICATPEITKNDLLRKIIVPTQFDLIIFDEAHRTIGNYAYSTIAEQFTSSDIRIIGMTATLPSEQEKAEEIVKRLKIQNIAHRTEESQDVKKYIQHTDIKWIKVELPHEMKEVQNLIKCSLNDKYKKLNKNGIVISVENKSLSRLLMMRDYILRKNKFLAKLFFMTIRIHYALNIFESHGVSSFLRFCDRMKLKKFGVNDLLTDYHFSRATFIAKLIQKKGIEHSKIIKLQEILRLTVNKTIVFTSYRDSVEIIHKALTKINIKSGFLIGKAGKTGLKQKKQIETVQKFRDNEYQVLIATRVGEEGLDISEVDNVIFYDNVPSSIRFIQRKGRTGRKYAGKIFVLITKNTIDETYYWIGQRKSIVAKNVVEKIASSMKKTTQKISLDKYF